MKPEVDLVFRLDFHLCDNMIDQFVFTGFVSGHKAVPVGIFFDFFHGMARMLDQDLVHAFLDPLKFLGMNHDFFGGSLHPGEGLMDHDQGIGECIAFLGGACGQQDGSH